MKNLENLIKRVQLGQFLSVTTIASTADMDAKQLKKSPYIGRVSKETCYTSVRLCDYENLASTKEKREQGVEAHKPTWWEWVEFPYIAKHKNNGTRYLVVKSIESVCPTSKFFLDGKEVRKADIADGLKKSNATNSSVYMLKLESITHLEQGGLLYEKVLG
jgi:hypothetical protein